MPKPYGTDRLRTAPDGRLRLESRLDKGWIPRVPKTGTRASFPGTAVLWDDEYYEVIEVSPMPAGVRYTLVPWDDANILRTFERYDAGAEEILRSERAVARRRTSVANRATLLAPLVGHLPGDVQERWVSEYGTAPILPTVLSSIPPFIIGVVCLVLFLADVLGAGSGIPLWILAGGTYFFAESLIRSVVAVSTGRPVGSLVGTVIYAPFRLGRPGKRTGAVRESAEMKMLKLSAEIASRRAAASERPTTRDGVTDGDHDR